MILVLASSRTKPSVVSGHYPSRIWVNAQVNLEIMHHIVSFRDEVLINYNLSALNHNISRS
jgi:hypothetical protein